MSFCAQILDAALVISGCRSVDPLEWDPSVKSVPPAKAVPAGLRRRLSGLGRTVAEAAFAIPGAMTDVETALVFSSRWGDLTASNDEIRALARGEDLSPTVFATSVHNGIAAMLTIAAQHTGFTTSVAGGDAPFARGWETAAALLSEHERVLLTVYDQGVEHEDPKHYALSLLLARFAVTPDEKGYSDYLRGPVLTMERRTDTKGLPDPTPLCAENASGASEPLAMLQWLLNPDEATVAVPTGRSMRVFAKNAALTALRTPPLP